MSGRGREMMKKIVRQLGGNASVPKGFKESLSKSVPDSKIVMNRAKRGLFAGKHIQFGHNISEDGGNKTKRTWKPNVQDKRLFSYILDRHIRVKVTTYALRCIDKAGGIDEYLLKTPYKKMDTELGVFWKAKIEKLYEDMGKMEVVLFSPEEEAKFEEELTKETSREQVRTQVLGLKNMVHKGRARVSYVVASADDAPNKLISNY